jgi:hypothetical protein
MRHAAAPAVSRGRLERLLARTPSAPSALSRARLSARRPRLLMRRPRLLMRRPRLLMRRPRLLMRRPRLRMRRPRLLMRRPRLLMRRPRLLMRHPRLLMRRPRLLMWRPRPLGPAIFWYPRSAARAPPFCPRRPGLPLRAPALASCWPFDACCTPTPNHPFVAGPHSRPGPRAYVHRRYMPHFEGRLEGTWLSFPGSITLRAPRPHAASPTALRAPSAPHPRAPAAAALPRRRSFRCMHSQAARRPLTRPSTFCGGPPALSNAPPPRAARTAWAACCGTSSPH